MVSGLDSIHVVITLVEDVALVYLANFLKFQFTSREGVGGGGWVFPVCGSLPKTLTLFMIKIYEIPYAIYDLTKNSRPYL